MIRRGLEWFGGSALTYLLLAACSGAPSGGMTAGEGGAPDITGAGGQPAAVGGNTVSMAGTVPVAMAAGTGGGTACECEPYVPPEPVVVEAAYDVTVEGVGTMFAVAPFPGKTMQDLAAVRVVVEYPPGVNRWPPGFVSLALSPYVQDGSVAVGCGSAQFPQNNATTVTFTLP